MASKKTNKNVSYTYVEKITNDLLIQFAYTLVVAVLTIFVFNATGVFKYGIDTYNFVRGACWVLFALFAVGGVVALIFYKSKDIHKLKTLSIYSFITALVMFWYVGVEKIPYYLKGIIPVLNKVSGTYKVIFCMFPLLGVAIIAEFVAYFIRYYSSSKK